MFSKINFIKVSIFLSLVSVLFYPVYITMYVNPSFHQLIIEEKEHNAEQIVRHFLAMFQISEISENGLSPGHQKLLEEFLHDLAIEKIRLFTQASKIVYSTDRSEIGRILDRPYFTEVVAKGNTYSKYIRKDARSLEGDIQSRDMVEIYVPLMNRDVFKGAIEIYYDISRVKKSYRKLLTASYVILAVISCLLLLFIITSGYQAIISIKKRKEAEEKVIRQRDELQKALAEVKTLRGILPLCSFCKKIRDDEGYWEMVDVYINKHSDADISHGICPECLKKNYPEEYEAIKKKRRNQE